MTKITNILHIKTQSGVSTYTSSQKNKEECVSGRW